MCIIQHNERTKYLSDKCTNLSFNLDSAFVSKSKAINGDKTFVVAEALDKTTYRSPSSSSSSLQQFVGYISRFLCFSSVIVNGLHSLLSADRVACLRFSSRNRLACKEEEHSVTERPSTQTVGMD